MAEHTLGARRAAAIIMAGREHIDTEYGSKSAEGVADLIDRETCTPVLIAACQAALDCLQSMTTDDFSHGGDRAERQQIAAALSLATGLRIEPY